MDHRDTSSSHGVTPFSHGAHSCEEPIDNLVSKRKRPCGKLDSTTETEEMIKKSKTALEKDGLGMHNRPVGDENCSQTAHEMIKAEANEEAAPSTELLVPKTHTKKEKLVDETLATPESDSDESDSQSQIGSTATGTSSHQINAAYIETAEQPEPYIHGLGMRMTSMEEMFESLKQDMCELKKGIKELKQGMDMLLQVYGIDPITLQPMGPVAKPAKDTISTP